MTSLDRALQRWRISKARRFIPRSARVLDIGCGDGALFRQLGLQMTGGVGISPSLPPALHLPGVLLVSGFFPQDMPDTEPFDAITMLAVLEHFPSARHAELRSACAKSLKPGAVLILTVPAPAVDGILKLLRALRLIDGMALEEHHGFAVEQTLGIFSPPDFQLLRHERFQLGLNHLFVFQRNHAGRQAPGLTPASPRL